MSHKEGFINFMSVGDEVRELIDRNIQLIEDVCPNEKNLGWIACYSKDGKWRVDFRRVSNFDSSDMELHS